MEGDYDSDHKELAGIYKEEKGKCQASKHLVQDGVWPCQ